MDDLRDPQAGIAIVAHKVFEDLHHAFDVVGKERLINGFGCAEVAA